LVVDELRGRGRPAGLDRHLLVYGGRGGLGVAVVLLLRRVVEVGVVHGVAID